MAWCRSEGRGGPEDCGLGSRYLTFIKTGKGGFSFKGSNSRWKTAQAPPHPSKWFNLSSSCRLHLCTLGGRPAGPAPAPYCPVLHYVMSGKQQVSFCSLPNRVSQGGQWEEGQNWELPGRGREGPLVRRSPQAPAGVQRPTGASGSCLMWSCAPQVQCLCQWAPQEPITCYHFSLSC